MAVDPSAPPNLSSRFQESSDRLRRLEQPGIWHAPTLLNGWSNYPGFSTTAYRRIGDVVSVRGLVRMVSGTPGVGSVIFQLPDGYRPETNWLFAAIDSVSCSRVDVQTNGDVEWVSFSPTGAAGYLSLSNVVFSIAPVLA